MPKIGVFNKIRYTTVAAGGVLFALYFHFFIQKKSEIQITNQQKKYKFKTLDLAQTVPDCY